MWTNSGFHSSILETSKTILETSKRILETSASSRTQHYWFSIVSPVWIQGEDVLTVEDRTRTSLLRVKRPSDDGAPTHSLVGGAGWNMSPL